MEKNGAICWECSKKKAKIKSEKTSIERYDVTHPRKSNIVKDKQKATCILVYGETNAAKSLIVQEKMKQTTLDRHGVENAFQSKTLMQKAKQTNLERRGVMHAAQCPIVQEKIKQTNLKLRGVEYPGQCPLVKEKSKATNLERIGVENPFQDPNFTAKSEKTCMEKYNVRHSSQDENVRLKTLKSGFRQKKFEMPSGRVVKVQGYEPFALRDLLMIHNETQIQVDSEGLMPNIMYYTPDGKSHRYYPDIFIPHENKIIEVKSKYTAGKGGRNVQLKKEETIKQGYIYEIWCYDGKGNRVEI
jgi:hypothetical protein